MQTQLTFTPRGMNVLIACEFSGITRDAFIARGHNAISCDLLPTERPGPHIEGDVRQVLRKKWDLIIAHPPCTRLCNSGVRWLLERELWNDMKDAAIFFLECLNGNSDRVAVENPIMHKYAVDIIGRNYDFLVQPWEHGHGETKATCFWVRGLPKLLPTKMSDGRIARVHREPPSDDRWKIRSRTYEGISLAMAEQWG